MMHHQKMHDICVSDTIYDAVNRSNENRDAMNTAIDRFLSCDFGRDADSAIVAALARNFDAPMHEHTAFGVYPYPGGDMVILYSEQYCHAIGYNSLIAFDVEDTQLACPDPLQHMIAAFVHAENVGQSHCRSHYRSHPH